jgi:hypothetical protein
MLKGVSLCFVISNPEFALSCDQRLRFSKSHPVLDICFFRFCSQQVRLCIREEGKPDLCSNMIKYFILD